MAGTVELFTEEDLELYFEDVCRGDYQSILALKLHEANQVIAYSLGRMGQLWTKLEERTRT